MSSVHLAQFLGADIIFSFNFPPGTSQEAMAAFRSSLPFPFNMGEGPVPQEEGWWSEEGGGREEEGGEDSDEGTGIERTFVSEPWEGEGNTAYPASDLAQQDVFVFSESKSGYHSSSSDETFDASNLSANSTFVCDRRGSSDNGMLLS
mmetsp:Transcript_48761/g.153055  ORF Transcript_48761/g.153055 Transcript_48761/m.153055 type:complete len:148 (-) Transcript_48761:602-1045(-)